MPQHSGFKEAVDISLPTTSYSGALSAGAAEAVPLNRLFVKVFSFLLLTKEFKK